jgi:hypothetical protein
MSHGFGAAAGAHNQALPFKDLQITPQRHAGNIREKPGQLAEVDLPPRLNHLINSFPPICRHHSLLAEPQVCSATRFIPVRKKSKKSEKRKSKQKKILLNKVYKKSCKKSRAIFECSRHIARRFRKVRNQHEIPKRLETGTLKGIAPNGTPYHLGQFPLNDQINDQKYKNVFKYYSEK